jgi:hypothetical protein
MLQPHAAKSSKCAINHFHNAFAVIHALTDAASRPLHLAKKSSSVQPDLLSKIQTVEHFIRPE